jgi:hypothetical protein
MRLSLLTLGIFAAVVCIEKPTKAQNGAWCLYQDGESGSGSPQCRYATFQQCLADRLGGSSCGPSPYPSSPEPRPSTRLQRRMRAFETIDSRR